MYNHFMAGCRIPHFDTLFMFGIHTHISQFPLRLSFPLSFPLLSPCKTLCPIPPNTMSDLLKHTV